MSIVEGMAARIARGHLSAQDRAAERAQGRALESVVTRAYVRQTKFETPPRRVSAGDQMRWALRLTLNPDRDPSYWWAVHETEQLPRVPEPYRSSDFTQSVRIADNGISTISKSVDFRQTSASITAPTITLLDRDSVVSNLLASAWTLNISVRYALVELFLHEVSEDIDDQRHLEHTFVVERPTWDRNAVLLKCGDIQREGARSTVLEPRKWKLLTSLIADPVDGTGLVTGIGSERFRTLGEQEDLFFQHSDAYPYHPNENLLYVRTPTEEVIAISAVEPVGFTNPQLAEWKIRERGCFGTEVGSVDVEVTLETQRSDLPDLVEHHYAVETAGSMLCLAQTGYTLDGRPCPRKWFPGLASWSSPDAAPGQILSFAELRRTQRWLDVGSLQAESVGFPLTIASPGKDTTKRFVDKQILAALPGVQIPNSRGKLELIVDEPLHPDAATAVTYVDGVDIVTGSLSQLALASDALGNPLVIRTGWDWRTEQYLAEPIFYDLGAEQLASAQLALKEFEFKLLADGFLTDGQKRKLSIILSDGHSYPRQLTSFETLATAARSRVGDVVRVESTNIRNSYSGAELARPLSRAFRVIRVEGPDWTGRMRYGLEGGFGVALERSRGTDLHAMPDEWYEQFTDISTVVPVSVGENGASELRGSHVIPPGIYGHLGNLRIRNDFRATIDGFGSRTGLVVRGYLSCESPNPFDGTGRGLHPGGAGETENAPAKSGEMGYFGRGTPQGAMRLRQVASSGIFSNARRYQFTGSYYVRTEQAAALSRPLHMASVPHWPVEFVDGILRGIPGDPSGSGGRGADAHSIDEDRRIGNEYSGPVPRASYRNVHFKDGCAGGRGGMAIGFISRGGAFGGDGGIVTDGGAAEHDGGNVDGSLDRPSGAPGAPGVPFWLMDGDFPPVVMGPERVKARFGRSILRGPVLSTSSLYKDGPGHSAVVSNAGQNVAGAIARSQIIPHPRAATTVKRRGARNAARSATSRRLSDQVLQPEIESVYGDLFGDFPAVFTRARPAPAPGALASPSGFGPQPGPAGVHADGFDVRWSGGEPATGRTGYELSVDGVVVATIDDPAAEAYRIAGLESGRRYRADLVAIGDEQRRSASASFEATTSARAPAPEDDAWFITVATTGRRISGTSNIGEGRSIVMLGSYTAQVEADGDWYVDVPASEDYRAGDTFNPYGETSAADGNVVVRGGQHIYTID